MHPRKHPNAEILARLAELAQVTDRPWEHFEMQDASGRWCPCMSGAPFARPTVRIRVRELPDRNSGPALDYDSP